MKTALHVNASPRPATSLGYRLAGELLAALRRSCPGLQYWNGTWPPCRCRR